MSKDRTYKSLVFTKHAWERKEQRHIASEAVYQAVEYPDLIREKGNSFTCLKRVQGRNIHAVVQFLEKEKKWLVISVWVRGENDSLPLQWQVIVFPFKLLWRIMQFVWKIGTKILRKKHSK